MFAPLSILIFRVGVLSNNAVTIPGNLHCISWYNAPLYFTEYSGHPNKYVLNHILFVLYLCMC